MKINDVRDGLGDFPLSFPPGVLSLWSLKETALRRSVVKKKGGNVDHDSLGKNEIAQRISGILVSRAFAVENLRAMPLSKVVQQYMGSKVI